MDALHTQFANLSEMSRVLTDDSWAIIDELVEHDSQRLRRQLFRTIFAEIEGTAFGFKFVALAGHELNQVQLSAAELALAKEETYALTEKGEASSQKAKLGFRSSLLFSLRLLARGIGRDWNPRTSDGRWDALRRAVAVRDRLMHPKSLDDLQISDDELISLAQGHDWFWLARTEVYASEPPQGSYESLLRRTLASNRASARGAV